MQKTAVIILAALWIIGSASNCMGGDQVMVGLAVMEKKDYEDLSRVMDGRQAANSGLQAQLIKKELDLGLATMQQDHYNHLRTMIQEGSFCRSAPRSRTDYELDLGLAVLTSQDLTDLQMMVRKGLRCNCLSALSHRRAGLLSGQFADHADR